MSRTGPDPSGFAMLAAIFLLVVLSGLAAAVAWMASAQHRATALDIPMAHASQAAQSALEWGAYQLMQETVFAQNCRTTTQTASMTFNGTMTGLTTTLSCTATSRIEGATTVYLHTLTATACNQPTAGACPNPAPSGIGYVERQIQTSILW